MADAPDREKDDTVKKSRRKKGGHGEEGHNLTEVQKRAEPLFQALLKKKKAKQATAGEFNEEMNKLYATAEKNMGIPTALLRSEFAFFCTNERRAGREAEYTDVERKATEAFRKAFEGTPFESLMNFKVAKGAVAT